MKGLMQDFPLTTQHIFWRAERLFGEKQIVTKVEGGTHRYTYSDFATRVRRLAAALLQEGVRPGDRIATFGWNTFRHHELYFAVPCIGAVLHTLNIRLFAEQLIYIANHAEDAWLFFDDSLIDVLDPLHPSMSTVKRFVRMGDVAAPFETDSHEELISSAEPIDTWPKLDEGDAAGMCYTSGTTGDPKGVVYSHRSTVLHAFGVQSGDGHGLREDDTTLTIVPMFHAMAWGHPYAATMAGCKQVHPGRFLTPDVICGLIQDERVTFSGAVPTIWIGVLDELRAHKYDLSSLRCLGAGGAPVPKALIKSFEEEFGVELLQGWGMTETSPLAAHGLLKSTLSDLSSDEKQTYKAKTGLPIPGVEIKIVDDEGRELAWDGEAVGEILVRGPWIASSYYNDPRGDSQFVDGWLRTGDVATIDALGYIQIVDRSKDLVKSGGEWISSVELEKHLMSHAAVKEAAVIAIAHATWTERPLACVVLREGMKATSKDLQEHLSPLVAKWWLPDDYVFIDEIPKTSVGKFDKKVLRAKFKDHRLPDRTDGD